MTVWITTFCLIIILGSLIFTARTTTRLSTDPSPNLLDGWIVALAQLLVISPLLGTIGHLSAHALALAHCLVTGFIWLLFRTIIPEPVSPSSPSSTEPFTMADWFIILIAVVPGGIALFHALPMAPGGTDIWTYHLAFPAEWHIWHDLRATVQHTGDPGPPFYPHHSGLIAHLLLTTLRSDLLAKFHQLPMAILGLLALYHGIRTLKIPRQPALTACALVATMPLVSSWITAAYADISLAGAMALLFYSVTRLSRSSSWHAALFFGLSTGVCAGFKAFGIYYSLPLIGWGLYHLLKTESYLAHKLSLWLSGSLLTGSFWFIRSWVYNGNPVFPYRLELFGQTLFPGLYGRADVLSHGFHSYTFMNQFSISALMQTLGLPGFILGAILLIGIIVAPKKQRILVVIPLIMMVQFHFLPYRYHPRFFLTALWMMAPVCAMFLAVCCNRFNAPVSGFPLLLAVCVSLTPYHGLSILHRFGAVGAVTIAAYLLEKISIGTCHISSVLKRVKVGYLLSGVIGCLIVLLPAATETYEHQKWNYHDSELGRVAQWVTETNQKEPDLRIAFAGFNTPYPLTGFRLGNTVRYLSRDGDSLKSWTSDRPFNPVDLKMQSSRWKQLVSETDTDVIVLGTLPGQPFGPEYFELRAMDTFELVYFESSYQCWMRSDRVHELVADQ